MQCFCTVPHFDCSRSQSLCQHYP